MKRRDFLAAGAAVLAAPRIAAAQGSRTLKFVPHADLASLDPVWTTADITRNFSLAVFDTLYGLDASLTPRLQMLAGERVENDGKLWELTLRDGLKFHDGTPVLARDVVASIQRSGKRDALVSVLASRIDEISAPSDKTVRIRLKRAFPLLRDALAQYAACIMPERLARTDANAQVPEIVGSGPFRFLANERVPGSLVAFARNEAYVPRADGTPSFTAGPKVAYFDRVEWQMLPDPATAAAAVGSGEIDWWENPPIDLVPSLKRNAALTIKVIDPYGSIGCLRFNHLHPPFDNVAIRRVVLSVVNQDEFMTAYAGADPSIIKNPAGLFAPGSPLASDAGTEALGRVKDMAQAKRDLAAAGYKGERIVVLGATTIPPLHAYSQIAVDLLRRIGMNVDYVAVDWGTVVQRRASREPIDKGGWNIFLTNLGGTGNVSPAASSAIRSGPAAWFGWPDNPKMEELREAWLDAPDLAAQKAVAKQMQLLMFETVPFVPLGFYSGPNVFRSTLRDIRDGFPQMYGVRRA
ncbi:ABC transporter substrate-binding protein [Limobrevibacterium gyesilva]|uniref:ABC transporter substrate-binding protein n=1 Tax=Limobrevibacterium gyesilva TaxID=2991712 RepID=A0AA42CEA4_9PROT|nr:ABC transporter substrate-binding protein [Limobrevibacterium gyesilva]MCW3475024.1 ABC transporter substrate-binding protein [Limobrevibacterium gyesilva]